MSNYIKYNEFSQSKQNEKSMAEYVADFMEGVDPDIFKPKITFLDISSVRCDNMIEAEPILQFRDYDNVVENICNVKDLQDGMSKVRKILDDSDYESYYMRTYKIDDTWTIDYGSHNTFFLVKEAK